MTVIALLVALLVFLYLAPRPVKRTAVFTLPEKLSNVLGNDNSVLVSVYGALGQRAGNAWTLVHEGVSRIVKRIQGKHKEKPSGDSLRKAESLYECSGCGNMHPRNLYSSRQMRMDEQRRCIKCIEVCYPVSNVTCIQAYRPMTSIHVQGV